MLNDIATWLGSSSTGYGQIAAGSTAYTIYKGEMTASTGNMIVLIQRPGFAPEALADGTIDNPGLQVLTLYATTSDRGYAIALNVQNRLRHVTNMNLPTSTGNRYLSIRPVSSPAQMGEDANRRMIWSQNFQVAVTYEAT